MSEPSALTIARGQTGAEATGAVLARVTIPAGPVALLAPPPPNPPTLRQATAAAVATFEAAGRSVVIHRPWTPPLVAPRAPLRRVRLPVGAQRFAEALLPAGLVSRSRVAVIAGATSPVALLASFAPARQRLAARLSGAGTASELAAGLLPVTLVLVEADGSEAIAAATDDLVVAQLWWLADRAGPGAGPWEDPEVQRLTHLGLGPRAAHDVRLDWAGQPPPAGGPAMARLARLGWDANHGGRR